MKSSQQAEIERLRSAFASASERSSAAGCIAPETIFAAVRGELPPDAVRDVVDHTAACPSCAEDWRLAAALVPPDERVATSRHPFSPGRLLGRPGLVAAAALLVAVVGISLIDRQAPPDGPVMRGDETRIESLVAEGATLPRERCVLSWKAGPPGTVYALEVTTEDWQPVAQVGELTTSAYRVPESALAGLPHPIKLLWRVEASLPGGRRLTSPTFVTTVE